MKTTTAAIRTSEGDLRWQVSIATRGGNRSWSGVAKQLDPETVDAVFILAGDGRRWVIPTFALEGMSGLKIGGTKYSEFEVQPTHPILEAVYNRVTHPSRIDRPVTGERRSGRAGPDCKSGASALSGFESHLPHSPVALGKERTLGRSGQAIVRGKRQMTLPARPYTEAGLELGDRIRFRAEGPGRIVLERIDRDTL